MYGCDDLKNCLGQTWMKGSTINTDIFIYRFGQHHKGGSQLKKEGEYWHFQLRKEYLQRCERASVYET